MLVTLCLVSLIVAIPDRIRIRRRRTRIDEQQFFASIHAELQAGASLRHALGAAAAGQEGLAALLRLTRSGAPMEEVATELSTLPENGRMAGAALRVASRSGGKTADVFFQLADRAATNANLARERRVLTAQARASAVVVGSLPVLWMVLGGLGRLQSLVADGGAAIAIAGVGMEAMGIALIWRLVAS